ncbi:uncharacterized protein BJ212DRAFT_1304919 [Suillus subaureus]|uniref:Uncharacterized protein n=1 Tax=Suillus subaureus TaxID=48587 RepID=A0A9P7DSD4_9AGAM|nr:uncharacterized protein BJ212DRAFT_1304919 [Suillus subaureus]KAG1801995.1 hypothetical protein BJ212DRAFT_1304919 [Suillus subaureus]
MAVDCLPSTLSCISFKVPHLTHWRLEGGLVFAGCISFKVPHLTHWHLEGGLEGCLVLAGTLHWAGRSSACTSMPNLCAVQHFVIWGLGGWYNLRACGVVVCMPESEGLGGGSVHAGTSSTPESLSSFLYPGKANHKSAVQGQGREGPSAEVLY